MLDYEVSGLTQKIEGVLKCKEDERKTELKANKKKKIILNCKHLIFSLVSTITLLFLNLSSKNYYELNTIILTFHFKVESTTEVKSHSQLPDDTPFIDFYSDDDNCSSINAALTHADSADRLDTEPGVCNVKPKSRQTEKRSAAWQFYDVVAADKVHQI